MLECFEVNTDSSFDSEFSIELVFELRQKSRAKAVMSNGEEVAWFLPRGGVLADGELLVAKNGALIRVVAADETVSEVHSSNKLLLARAAYHLGNRHVALQIEEELLRFQHDHVLDDMVRGLGLTVSIAQKPFHPEAGAYHGEGSHSHGHSHSDNHSHDHGDHHH